MKALRDAIFEMGEEENLTLQNAYFQLLIVKALLYFGTAWGKGWFVPAPAMIAMVIAKASYKWATGMDPGFLPANRVAGVQYPEEMFKKEDFWWDEKTIHDIHKNIRALPRIMHDMNLMVRWLISAEYSILHPRGLMGIRIASWWPPGECGVHRENMMIHIHERQREEVEEIVLPRLGEEYAQWCREVGEEMAECLSHDNDVVYRYCSECHSPL